MNRTELKAEDFFLSDCPEQREQNIGEAVKSYLALKETDDPFPEDTRQ